MLLAGTNDKDILTFDIKHLLEMEPFQFDASSMGISEHMYEEEKELHSIRESDEGSEYRYKSRYDDFEEEEKVPDDYNRNLDDTDFLNKQEAEDDEQLKTIL